LGVEFRRLSGPMEFLDLPDGGTVRLRVRSWERGSAVIHTTRDGEPADVEIPVLRVHLPEGVKPFPPMYYDVSSKTLQAQWIPMLALPGFERFEYVVTKHGVAPRARFTLERVPLPGA